jgi:hypothetical protein
VAQEEEAEKVKTMRAILLLCLLLAGCYGFIPTGYDPVYPQVLPTGAGSPQGIGRWLELNVEWVDDNIHDTSEYWQSPDQTYQWRSGDCEDFAILMMYLIRLELGGWPELVIGTYDGSGHGWVRYQGVDYEAQGGAVASGDPRYAPGQTVGYAETLWRSEHRHKDMRAAP